ncbi:hypothetical protein GUITHDRAFT_116293 [Guillardia theta CCMP2712]|uniref:Uncharacterized protein n=1 Tax=Guillardia theta (strain CCMP2712) TaxID=905079 RepID=L1IMI4_GUITC|nr:hypothetical protein GUITHDRAFT_116293 [Guillardia theta CCMP2712]EKX37483.1 hypothetical protein GUITHDRAFT_116293 [Guillardia theta CCMP2712]|eukprot:XP_005824463.1 hypothetical protein GUITHDRAFT_116293 [Guillardia theta CCMP2712]
MSLNGAKPSAFLQRFQNKISVVAKDGSHAKIGEPTTKTRPAPDIRDILDDQRPWRRKDSNMVSSKTMPRKENSHSVSYQTTDDISPEYGMKGLRFKTSKDGSSGRSVKELGDGYAKQDVNFLNPDDQLAYSRKARPVEYKPYSEKEYKAQYALGEYYELGKLGPDLDVNELNEKRQRQERIKAYAEAVRHENKNIIGVKRTDTGLGPSYPSYGRASEASKDGRRGTGKANKNKMEIGQGRGRGRGRGPAPAPGPGPGPAPGGKKEEGKELTLKPGLLCFPRLSSLANDSARALPI